MAVEAVDVNSDFDVGIRAASGRVTDLDASGGEGRRGRS